MLPLYVANLNFTETDVLVVAPFAKFREGVNDHDVADDLVAMVPEYEPDVQVNVCVKLDDFLSAVIVCAVPSVPALTDNEEALAIVFKANVPEPVQFTDVP